MSDGLAKSPNEEILDIFRTWVLRLKTWVLEKQAEKLGHPTLEEVLKTQLSVENGDIVQLARDARDFVVLSRLSTSTQGEALHSWSEFLKEFNTVTLMTYDYSEKEKRAKSQRQAAGNVP